MFKTNTTVIGIVIITVLLCAKTVVAGKPEKSEFPGFDRLSEPFEDITEEQRAEFFEGLEIFEKNFIGEGEAQIGGGPLSNGIFSTRFNGNSCFTCHNAAENPDPDFTGPRIRKDGGNGGFRAVQATAWDETTGSCDHLEDIGGPGFQRRISDDQVLVPLAQDRQDAIDAGLDEYVPVVSSHGIPVGPLDDRTTNDLFGLGLIDALRDQDIVMLADPDDADGDGISGRVHWDGNHVGKFGRKAEVAHLDHFNAEAAQNEQGVTNPDFPHDGFMVTAQNPDGSLLAEELIDNIDGLEMSEHELHVLNTYVRLLAEPQRNKTLSRSERIEGLHIFNKIGCNGCHTKAMTTGPHEIEALNEVDIAPHSDFLLHSMGDELAEGCKGDARPAEWRTEPLWGLRFVTQYLHDGRAESIRDAIKQHALADPAENEAECPANLDSIVSTSENEAIGSVKAYCSLSEEDKTKLVNYLDTL